MKAFLGHVAEYGWGALKWQEDRTNANFKVFVIVEIDLEGKDSNTVGEDEFLDKAIEKLVNKKPPSE